MDRKSMINQKLTEKQRKNAYQNIKNVLSDISTPMNCIGEVSQNWKVQEELKKLIETTGK